MTTARRTDPSGIVATISGATGIILYGVAGFFLITSGLAVPIPWLVPWWLLWLGGIYLVVRTFRERRVWTPLIPVVMLVVFAGYLALGSALFDWTA